MATRFAGFDHIDTRVRSLKAVEAFYDRLMPELGLSEKSYSYVDDGGEWNDSDANSNYNTVEYHEPALPGQAVRFIGFIEDPAMKATDTRIAFQIPDPAQLTRWQELLQAIGAVNIEPSATPTYPALFFEDPAGTKLELCARSPKK